MESTTPNGEDYVFRFKLDPRSAVTDDPLADMIRTFIEGFLEIGCFTHKGREVTVDGFRLNGRNAVTALTPGKPG